MGVWEGAVSTGNGCQEETGALTNEDNVRAEKRPN